MPGCGGVLPELTVASCQNSVCTLFLVVYFLSRFPSKFRSPVRRHCWKEHCWKEHCWKELLERALLEEAVGKSYWKEPALSSDWRKFWSLCECIGHHYINNHVKSCQIMSNHVKSCQMVSCRVHIHAYGDWVLFVLKPKSKPVCLHRHGTREKLSKCEHKHANFIQSSERERETTQRYLEENQRSIGRFRRKKIRKLWLSIATRTKQAGMLGILAVIGKTSSMTSLEFRPQWKRRPWLRWNFVHSEKDVGWMMVPSTGNISKGCRLRKQQISTFFFEKAIAQS